jgi:hypothetical protein
MRRSKKKVSNTREPVDYPIRQIERLGVLIDEVELKDLASRSRRNKEISVKARGKRRIPRD